MKKSEIESYIEILKHEMAAEYLKSVDKDFIEEIVLRAGGNPSEVAQVIEHPSIRITDGGEFYVA